MHSISMDDLLKKPMQVHGNGFIIFDMEKSKVTIFYRAEHTNQYSRRDERILTHHTVGEEIYGGTTRICEEHWRV